jgi:hypothetical protein
MTEDDKTLEKKLLIKRFTQQPTFTKSEKNMP